MANLASLNKFLANLKQEMDIDLILKECCQNLNELFKFKVTALMLVDESDQSFILSYAEPKTQTALVQAEFDYQVEQGIFAWALSQTKPVIEETQDKKNTVILHSLYSRSRIRGMFIGITDQYDIQNQNNSLDTLSVILLITSNILENNELYQCINEQNKHLEETITQRTFELEKAKAAAEAANEAKSQFLANISHEIRTPLTAIVGYADLIRYKQLSTREQDSAVQDILQASKHLSNIINDILDISKIEANKLEIEILHTSLFHLVNSVVAIAKGQAKEKGLAFKLNYRFPLPKSIDTDPTRLKQILLNLTNNAVKFTDSGEISIEVVCRPEQEQISFLVTDTGIGITGKQQDLLFQKFVQADASISRSYGGTGLGLAISKQLAEKLGGTIKLQSSPGKGCCFEVIISTGAIDNSSFVYSLEQVPEQEQKINPWTASEQLYGHILLAEDNINNQQLISLFLTKAGISVDIVDNGSTAVEKAITDNYDVILMDMQMPQMNGIEATKLLRATGYADPIIALTANATIDVKRQCHDVGFDDFLSKPIEVENFFNTLSRFLKTSPLIEASLPVDDPDFQNISNRFTEGFPETLLKMFQTFELQDWQALKSQAHQLKGIAASFGYKEMGKTSSLIESNIELENFDNIPQLLKELQYELEKIIHEKFISFNS